MERQGMHTEFFGRNLLQNVQLAGRSRWSNASVLAIGPKVRGFKPGRGRLIKGP
jgi:hypothetical protein